MKLSENQFIRNALMNLTLPKKNELLEKHETVIKESQRHIEQMKQMLADEARYQKGLEAERIAKKIARGESVTIEEKEQLRGVDAEKLRKAEQANLRRKEINARLANATTKEQAKAILLEETISAGTIIQKGDEQYGELLMEAVNQAEADHNGRRKTQAHKSAHLIDIRL